MDALANSAEIGVKEEAQKEASEEEIEEAVSLGISAVLAQETAEESPEKSPEDPGGGGGSSVAATERLGDAECAPPGLNPVIDREVVVSGLRELVEAILSDGETVELHKLLLCLGSWREGKLQLGPAGFHSPVKRGRGRPKKEVSADRTPLVPPVKRPRGRPRKNPLDVIAPTPKRGRGRPRKNPLPDTALVVKRAPGRPRKLPAVAESPRRRAGRKNEIADEDDVPPPPAWPLDSSDGSSDIDSGLSPERYDDLESPQVAYEELTPTTDLQVLSAVQAFEREVHKQAAIVP